MRERFHIRISTYKGLCFDAQHYYGKIEIPASRNSGKGIFGLEVELKGFREEKSVLNGKPYKMESIRFDSIPEVIEAARKWFLESSIVLPGDKLVMWNGYQTPEDIDYWTLSTGTVRR